MSDIVPPSPTESIVEPDGSMEQRFRSWTQQVSSILPSAGTGSPEGVVEAPVTAFYMDNAGLPGNVLYIKKVADIGGDRRKGWELV